MNHLHIVVVLLLVLAVVSSLSAQTNNYDVIIRNGKIIDGSTRQLVLIPMVTNLSGGSTWPHNAPYQIKVTGFAWFVIESCGDLANPTYCQNNDGYQVNGKFVKLEDTDPGNQLGGYDPNAGTNFQIELTA